MTIECKGLEPKTIKDFAGYIVLSNYDASLRIEMGDGHIICLDVSSRYKGNMEYFKCLGKILDNPNTPDIFMNYLLKHDFSDWILQNIPNTKIRVEIMWNQLPNPIQFIIDHTSSQSIKKIDRPYCTNLYQEYIAWCENNGEKTFANNILGKKFSQIGIDRTRLQNNGKRKYHYILNCFKIITKLRESDLSDIKEFSDTPQADVSPNETTDISIFNMLEIIPSKIISPQPVNNSSLPSKDNQNKSIQDFFDYVIKDIHTPVASTSEASGISKTFKIPEPVIDKPETSKLSDSKPINEVSSAILPTRAQCEERFRKWAIDHGEDPDVFVIITEKDVKVFYEYQDRMMSDADAVDFVKEDGIDVNDIFYISRRERLISEEIYLCNLEDARKFQIYVYDNEEW